MSIRPCRDRPGTWSETVHGGNGDEYEENSWRDAGSDAWLRLVPLSGLSGNWSSGRLLRREHDFEFGVRGPERLGAAAVRRKLVRPIHARVRFPGRPVRLTAWGSLRLGTAGRGEWPTPVTVGCGPWVRRPEARTVYRAPGRERVRHSHLDPAQQRVSAVVGGFSRRHRSTSGILAHGDSSALAVSAV